MSYSKETRVVDLQFNNKQFEANVSQTLDSLDKLDAKLEFKGAEKGFKELEKAAKNVDLSGLEKAVNSIESRFVNLGAMLKTKVLDTITDSVLSIGTRTLKMFSGTEPMLGGWQKYEQQVGAVQTILNSTGESMEEVSKWMDKLSWYTDETSYYFSDMVNNISKFTSQGIKIGDATDQMIGIANAAGLAGVNAEGAGHAMEGFSKAMARGYMDTLSWKWIQTARMETPKLKQAFIDAAEGLGVLHKVGEDTWETMSGTEVTLGTFYTTLKDKWVNSDVMQTVLKQFGSYTDRVYQIKEALDAAGETSYTTAEIMENLGKGIGRSEKLFKDLMSAVGEEKAISLLAEDFDELGEKGMRASQETKTFADMMGALQEVVTSGWRRTMDIVVGNYEEAKEMWSTFVEDIWDIFAVPAEARNELLQSWKDMGGRDDLIQSVKNLFQALMSVVEPIKTAFRDVFPKQTAENLADITYNIRLFTERLILSQEQGEKLHGVFYRLFSIFKKVTNVFKAFIVLGVNLVKIIGAVATAAWNATGGVRDMVSNLLNWVRTNHELRTTLLALGSVILLIVGRVYLMKAALAAAMVGFVSAIGLDNIKSAIESISRFISSKAIPAILKLGETVGQLGIKIYENLQAVWRAPGTFLQKIAGTVKVFWGTIFSGIKSFFAKVKSLGIWSEIVKGFSDTVQRLKTGISNLLTWLNSLNAGQIIMLTVGAAVIFLALALTRLLRTLSVFVGRLGQVTGVFSALKSYLWALTSSTVYAPFLQIAAGLAIITASLYVLATKVPWDTLWKAAAILGGFTVALGAILVLAKKFSGMGKVANNVTKFFDFSGWKINMQLPMQIMAISVAMLSFATAIALLAKTIQAASPKQMQESFRMLLVAGGLMVALIGVLNRIPASSKGILNTVKLVAPLLAFSASVWLVAQTMINIAKSEADLKTAGRAVAQILITLGALGAIMGRVQTGFPVGSIVGSLVAMELMVNAFRKMSDPDRDRVVEILGQIWDVVKSALWTFLSITALDKAATAVFKNFGTLKGSIAGISGLLKSIALLFVSVAVVSSLLSSDDIEKMKSVAVVLGLLSGWLVLIGTLSTYFGGKNDPLKSLSKLAGAMSILALTLGFLSLFKDADTGFWDLAIVTGILSVALVALGAALAGAGQIAGQIKKNDIVFLVTTAVVIAGLLAGLTILIHKVGMDAVSQAVTAFTVAILALAIGLVIAGAGISGLSVGPILSAALLAVSVGAALALIATQPWENIKAAMNAFVVAVGVLVLALGILAGISATGIGAAGLGVAAVVMVALAGATLILAGAIWVFADAAQKFVDMCEQMSKWSQTARDNVTKALAAIGAGIRIFVKSVAQGVGEGIMIILNAVVQGLYYVAASIVNFASHLMDLIIAGFTGRGKEALAEFNKSGTELAKAFMSGFREAADIHSPSRAMAKNADYLAAGLVKAANKDGLAVASAGAQMANSFISGFNNAAGIHSPSDETEKSGENLTAGLEEGVKKGSGNVVKTAHRGGSQAVKGVTDGIKQEIPKAKSLMQRAGESIGNALSGGIADAIGNIDISGMLGGMLGDVKSSLLGEGGSLFDMLTAKDLWGEALEKYVEEEAGEVTHYWVKMTENGPWKEVTKIGEKRWKYVKQEGSLLEELTGGMDLGAEAYDDFTVANESAGDASAKTAEELQQEAEEFAYFNDVTNYARPTLRLFTEQLKKTDAILKDTSAEDAAITKTQQMIMEHSNLIGTLDASGKAIMSWAQLSEKQVRTAGAAWEEFQNEQISKVQSTFDYLSDPFQSMSEAPSFADVLGTMTNSATAAQGMSEALERLSGRLVDPLLQRLASDMDLSTILAWDKFSDAEIQALNEAYIKWFDATEKAGTLTGISIDAARKNTVEAIRAGIEEAAQLHLSDAEIAPLRQNMLGMFEQVINAQDIGQLMEMATKAGFGAALGSVFSTNAKEWQELIAIDPSALLDLAQQGIEKWVTDQVDYMNSQIDSAFRSSGMSLDDWVGAGQRIATMATATAQMEDAVEFMKAAGTLGQAVDLNTSIQNLQAANGNLYDALEQLAFDVRANTVALGQQAVPGSSSVRSSGGSSGSAANGGITIVNETTMNGVPIQTEAQSDAVKKSVASGTKQALTQVWSRAQGKYISIYA